MEHPVIDSPCRAGLSPLAVISHVLSTMGKSPRHIAVIDVGYSGRRGIPLAPQVAKDNNVTLTAYGRSAKKG